MREDPVQLQVQNRIAALDTALFDRAPSSSLEDRRSLLALQEAVAGRRNPCRYLEIGSEQGGSIQPHLQDSRCAGIVSIDNRSVTPPDERGRKYRCRKNTTQQMIENLPRVSPEQLGKPVTFDVDTTALNPSQIPFQPDVCFIDGEHTGRAVFRDFKFCLSVTKKPAPIYCHEGEFDIHTERHIWELLVDNHVGYLAGLESVAGYRTFSNLPVLRHARLAAEDISWRAAWLGTGVKSRLRRLRAS